MCRHEDLSSVPQYQLQVLGMTVSACNTSLKRGGDRGMDRV